MASPRVSVVMPARNAETTVSAAIRSLRDQDLDDFEIILVDHASTDGTYRLMLEQAHLDPRIRVFQCHGSFVEAVNMAWQKATGELIARMDGDDVASPARLRLQMEYLAARPDLAGCATRVRILKRIRQDQVTPPDDGYRRYEKWVNSVTEPADISAQRFIDSPVPNPTIMVRRVVLEALGGYLDPPWAEDYDLWLRLLERGYQLGKVPEVLLDWHDAEGRATRTLERYSLTRFQEAKAHYLARLPSVRDLGVVICGAGPIGKEMANLLRREQIKVHAFIEVNPRQIGNVIAGSPVLGTEHVAHFLDAAVMLPAVGRGSGRERIRVILKTAGFIEGDSFFCVA